jgi:hypothetical protein
MSFADSLFAEETVKNVPIFSYVPVSGTLNAIGLLPFSMGPSLRIRPITAVADLKNKRAARKPAAIWHGRPRAHCFLLSLALGLRFPPPHLRHLVALGGFVAEHFMHTDLLRSLLSASSKRAIFFPLECAR